MSSIRMTKQSRRRVSERKEIFPNANKFSAKRQLAMKWLHNIGTGHTVGKCNFYREMVSQDHVTVDLEHRLLGLCKRRLLNEATVPTEFVHITKIPGPKGRWVVHAKNGLAKGKNKQNVCKYYKWSTRISFNVFPL